MVYIFESMIHMNNEEKLEHVRQQLIDQIRDGVVLSDGHCRELEGKFTIVGEVTVTQNPPVVEPDYEPSVLADGSLNPDGEYGRMR